jgi:hypothetical protein
LFARVNALVPALVRVPLKSGTLVTSSPRMAFWQGTKRVSLPEVGRDPDRCFDSC